MICWNAVLDPPCDGTFSKVDEAKRQKLLEDVEVGSRQKFSVATVIVAVPGSLITGDGESEIEVDVDLRIETPDVGTEIDVEPQRGVIQPFCLHPGRTVEVPPIRGRPVNLVTDDAFHPTHDLLVADRQRRDGRTGSERAPSAACP